MASSESTIRALATGRRLYLIGGILIAATMMAASLSIWDRRQQTIASHQRELANLSLSLAEQTARSMQAVDLVVQETQSRIAAAGANNVAEFGRRMVAEEIHHFLSDRLRALDQAQGIGLVDAAGMMIASSRVWPLTPLDLSDSEVFTHFRDRDDHSAFIGNPVRSRVTGGWIVPFARRINDTQGAFLGIVVAVIDLRYFEEFYKSITLQEGGSVSILSLDGTILARYPHFDTMTGQKIPAQSEWHSVVAQGGGTFFTPGYIDGVARLGAVHPMSEYPLAITVTVPEDAALAEWRRFAIVVSVVAAVVAICFAALFHALARGSSYLQATNRELNEARDSLLETMEHLNRVQRLAGVGSLEVDITGETEKVIWSPSACALFGIDPACVEDTLEFFLRYVHPDDRAKVKQAARLANTTATAASPLEYRIIRPDGVERVLHRENAIYCDENGKPIRRTATYQDITEFKRAEAQLREAKEAAEATHDLLAEVVESVPAGLTVHDADDQLILCNSVARSYFPRTEHLLVQGSKFEDFARAQAEAGEVPEARGREEAWFRERMRRHRLPENNITRQYADGRWVQISERRMSNGAIIGIRLDITELKKAEAQSLALVEQLQHSQKLEALGTLAGGIAHELNNALVPVLGLAKLTIKHLPTVGQAQQNLKNLNRIAEAAERARALVKKILAFSRKETPTRSNVDLPGLVHTSIELLRPVIPSTIRFEESLETVPLVLADPDQLHQVLVNLITNAADAIGVQHGTIYIALGPAHDGLELEESQPRSNPSVCLSVRDTGCGMDERTIKHIFDPFFTTKAVGQGSGLGLSIVHGIITQHGGRIAVQSELGRGTCIHVHLPSSTHPAEFL